MTSTTDPKPPSQAPEMDPAGRLATLLRAADELAHRNELQAALQRYGSVLAAVPAHPHALLGAAFVLYSSENLTLASKYLRRALAAAPAVAGAWTLMASLRRKWAETAGAAIAAWRAVALDPGSVPRLAALGEALIGAYEADPKAAGGFALYEKALAFLDRANALDPNAVNQVLMAGYHVAIGDLDGALSYYDAYCRKSGLLDDRGGPEAYRLVPRATAQAIGHTAALDVYVKMRTLGWRPPHEMKLVAAQGYVANRHYVDYWRPYVTIVDDPAEIALLEASRQPSDCAIGGLVVRGKTGLLSKMAAAAHAQWEREGRPPLLQVSEEDRKRGRSVLRAWGMGDEDWFVGLHVRESGFHESGGRADPHIHRNASIASFDAAIDNILARGGWIIRLGDPSMTPIRPRDRVIDYALGSKKSEWMDVFLCGSCRFFLGGASGLQLVPYTFGVPCAVANASPMGQRPVASADIFVPKLYWSKRETRQLTFAESTAPPLGHTSQVGVFEARGIELIENTPEDIAALVEEMLDRLEGTLAYTEEDERLQAQFRTETGPHSAWGTNSRIGRSFLRRHANLLKVHT
ncbi:MAG: TIGR04372 family glycosyltransferase [Proteobacteria bacterium]|nr:TIGR04372 family glycosyltransferase [Pseudomonadota bacterium]MBI3497193.1 TIGR04372 family glycosyltransferase [Pseudomonadota bacterium]